MTILWGDTGKIVYGPLKKFTISANPYELLKTTTGTSTSTDIMNLPSAEPSSGDGLITYTLQQSDLPTMTPSPLSTKYTAYLIVSGKNSSGATVTLNYSLYKNGTAIVSNATQTGVVNNNFWTHSHYRFYDVNVGDTLKVTVWCATAGVTLDYVAVVVFPTRLELTKALIVKDLNITVNNPVLTKGTPGVLNNSNWLIYPASNTTFTIGGVGTSLNQITIGSLSIHAGLNGFSLGRINNGDSTQSTNTQSSATLHPAYSTNYFPTSISFREILR